MPLLQSFRANTHGGVMIDLPRISPPITTLDHQPNNSTSNYPSSTPSTSLPSFAAFKEHATTRTDDVDGPEIAPMSSRLSCHSCTKLQPWVRDVAVAVAELDESVQTYCNKSVTRVGQPCHTDDRSIIVGSFLSWMVSLTHVGRALRFQMTT